MEIVHENLPSYLTKEYTPETNLSISSIIRYLPILAKYDTWRSIKYEAKRENFPTIIKVIKYGLKKGFITVHNEYNKSTGRMVKKFLINPGKYIVRTRDIEGLLEIEVEKGKDTILVVSLKIGYKI